MAAILGIDVECIVKVEHRSGLYHCKDETIQKPDGTTIKSHEFWCEPPFYADCCTVVYVKARTKSEDCTNGYVALKRDKNQQIESIFMIYDTDLLNNAKWLKDGMVILENEHPLVNSSDLGLCKDNEYVSLPSGLYRLSSFGPFQYFEIKVSNLKFNEGILIEQ
ncbi:MAG: hypothetical protein MJZ52_04415 [Bacteroidales bacterium]|nr:hypothetical protein [Bacteroidales bacterium]